jgi:hypothetical protein
MSSTIGAIARLVRDGYDRKSAYAFGLLLTIGAAVGYRWSDLVDANGGMDWLLLSTWIAMAALLCWGVMPRRDLVLIAVGFVGGGVIEWWGTTSKIWTYFTLERPPLWILPAWPIAAIAIDRMSRLLDRALGERKASIFVNAYWLCLPTFVLWMFAFSRHSAELTSTRVVWAAMIGVTLSCTNPRRDVLIFAAGSFLGIFLEYWGTSRQCWTYYTHEVPPPVATFAHGFASVAFARGAEGLEWVLEKVGVPGWRQRQLLNTVS